MLRRQTKPPTHPRAQVFRRSVLYGADQFVGYALARLPAAPGGHAVCSCPVWEPVQARQSLAQGLRSERGSGACATCLVLQGPLSVPRPRSCATRMRTQHLRAWLSSDRSCAGSSLCATVAACTARCHAGWFSGLAPQLVDEAFLIDTDKRWVGVKPVAAPSARSACPHAPARACLPVAALTPTDNLAGDGVGVACVSAPTASGGCKRSRTALRGVCRATRSAGLSWARGSTHKAPGASRFGCTC